MPKPKKRVMRWWEVNFSNGRLDVNVLVRCSNQSRAERLARPLALAEVALYGDGWGHGPSDYKTVCQSVVDVTDDETFWTDFDIDRTVKTPFVFSSGT